MTVTSMTGFARVDGMEAGYGWVWEVKKASILRGWICASACRKVSII